VTKARQQIQVTVHCCYYILNVWHLLLYNWLILWDLVKCFMEKQHRFICHYNPFSQTVRLKKTTSKRTFFCFRTACICNVWKECRLVGMQFLSRIGMFNLHCFRWHKFTINVLLYNAQYFYVVDSDMVSEIHTQCTVVFVLQNGYVNAPQYDIIRYTGYLVRPLIPGTSLFTLLN
jgi:hypothetical protein